MSAVGDRLKPNGFSDFALARGRYLMTVFLCVLLWGLAVWLLQPPDYMVPSPWSVALVLGRKPRLFLSATLQTLSEAFLGFCVGCVTALLIGFLAGVSARLRAMIEPFLVLSQTFPLHALAPLLVLGLGFGRLPIVIASALICFFPLAMATVRGLTDLDRNLLAVADSLGASRAVTLTKFRLPSALPEIASALKVCATLAVIGAVIGEFVNPQGGLGREILMARTFLKSDVMFAALFLLGIIGLTFHQTASAIEKLLLRKRRMGSGGTQ